MMSAVKNPIIIATPDSCRKGTFGIGHAYLLYFDQMGCEDVYYQNEYEDEGLY